jgi:hypothetical protein
MQCGGKTTDMVFRILGQECSLLIDSDNGFCMISRDGFESYVDNVFVSGVGLASDGFDLGERHFDGIHVGRIGRQDEEVGSGFADQVADEFAFVAVEIVHDDDITWLDRWQQDLLDIVLEAVSVPLPAVWAACYSSWRLPGSITSYTQ